MVREIHIPEMSEQFPAIHIDESNRRDVPVVIVRTDLGGAIDPFTGYRYRVVATKHDRDWPGTKSVFTFSVERTNHQGRQDQAVGFFSELECWQYLTGSGQMAVEYPDLDGRPVRDVRRCLGIPDAYVRKG